MNRATRVVASTLGELVGMMLLSSLTGFAHDIQKQVEEESQNHG